MYFKIHTIMLAIMYIVIGANTFSKSNNIIATTCAIIGILCGAIMLIGKMIQGNF